MTAPLAAIAAAEFRNRLAFCRERARTGEWNRDVAEHRARLWLAIAADFGADLAELEVDCIFPRGRKVKLRPAEIADPDEYTAELARARDVALRNSLSRPNDLRALQRAWDLQALAVAMGCPPTTVIEPIEPDPRCRDERRAA